MEFVNPIALALPLNEQAWRADCAKAASDARKRCGQSHDYYVDLLSEAIDCLAAKLPVEQRHLALEIAAEEFDYATPEEREAAQESNAELGCCMHGIDRNCCPAGCGG